MARLGRTELDVYPLGLGGIPLMRISDAEARAVVAAATSGGINFADTAEGYGESEARLLKRGLKKAARRMRNDQPQG